MKLRTLIPALAVAFAAAFAAPAAAPAVYMDPGLQACQITLHDWTQPGNTTTTTLFGLMAASSNTDIRTAGLDFKAILAMPEAQWYTAATRSRAVNDMITFMRGCATLGVPLPQEMLVLP